MGTPFKVIVAGGRDFKNYALLKSKLDNVLKNKSSIVVVSGKASGADTLGEKWASERNHPVKQFPADWDTYGRSAGPRRNEEMAKYADACIVFWDRRSAGTRNMIETAKKYKLPLRIFHY